MQPPGELRQARVAILGLGLMGGSLAMALRGHCQVLMGADPNPAAIRMAIQRHVVDQVSQDPAEILPPSNLVILAAPVFAILDLISQLPELHPGPAVVLDLGSTKTKIVQALSKLPKRFDPLGGHPMCGKETLSLANADPGMFQGAAFAFTPLPRTSSRAHALADELAEAVGAHPVWLDPVTHDRWTAASSHLPYLTGAALINAFPSEAAPLVGPGFHSTTRLAATPSKMMLEVIATNREEIMAALERFRQNLDELGDRIAGQDWKRLQESLDRAAARREDLVRRKMGGQESRLK